MTEPTWDEVLAEVFDWADNAVPHTADSDVHKFKEEAEEFLAHPSIGEACDVLMIITHWAHLRGENLKAEVIRKLAENKKRTWKQREDGTWKHV